ncbi:MAG: RNA methyltransferase [Candidatus Binataceae bacterium]
MRKATNLPANFAFILFKTKTAGNIGAAARALRNMGFADLRIVEPQARITRAASAMAVHGRDVLERARVFDDLPAAIADCALAIGTTSRSGLYRSGARPIREIAPELIRESRANRIAILFGPEDFGLTNRELKLCNRLATIPAASDYASLNLAQAVMVVAYELAIAAGAATEPAKPPLELASPTAVDAMFSRMAGALIAIGFVPADNPDHIMFALRGMLGRSGVTPRELDILNGLVSQIRWFAGDGRDTLEAKRRAGKKLR